VQMFLEVYFKRKNNLPVLWLLLGTLILMGLSLISPPNGFGTLTYLSQLTHDRTIAFIAEWQPRAWSAYLLDLWPFLLLSFFALAVGKKQWIFNGLLLCMTIYLSRQAVRHEILCIYASIATVFYQLDRSVWIGRAEEWMKQKYILAAVLLIILLVTATHTAIARSFAYERPDNLFGFGQFDLARGATDFIEREHITGNMFNTYGIGGYLINRGYPDRKVFIDGRNVDYGFDFMAHTYAAGINPDHWKELENTYNLSYALIDYDAIKQKGSLPYSMILDHNPDWSLVYLDDWVAVYLKNIPSNQPVISRLKYALLNPTDLQLHDTFDAVSDSDLPALVTELQRMSKESPTSIKGLVALGKISLKQNHLEDAEKYATEAMHLRPYAAEPVALIAGAYVQAQDWVRAADAYRHLLSLVGNDYPNVDHAFMKQIFEKAKQSTTGAQKTKEVSASGSVMKSAVASGTGNLAVNPLGDAITFNEQGLAQAGAGQYDKAMQSFSAAVLLNPGFAEAWNNVCALDLTLKKFPDALDACRHAVAINATYADAHFNLALALFDSALFTEAEKEALLAKKLGRVQESDQLLLNIRKKTQ
jgi:tetratricopeptide (TPR) repeat protein